MTDTPVRQRAIFLEGPSGAGKSALASQLRAVFGLGVLEAGPLYRFAAHCLNAPCDWGARSIADDMRERFRTGQLSLDTTHDGFGAACTWAIGDEPFGEDVWFGSDDETLQAVSADRAVQQAVRTIVCGVLVEHDRPLVVVAHRASAIADAEDLLLRLACPFELRRERKWGQFNAAVPMRDGDWFSPPYTSRCLDTTGRSPTAISATIARKWLR